MSAPSKWLIIAAFVLTLFALASSQPVYAVLDIPPAAGSLFAFAPDTPLPLNHFWCYQITTSKPVSETVLTQDQFDVKPRNTRVREAVRLCNPVQKTHNGVVTQILFPNDHLLLYRTGKHKGDPKHEVAVRNQFGAQRLAVYLPAEGLMVPTRKLPHDPPKNTDHFKCYAVVGQPINVGVLLEDQFQKFDPLVLAPFALCNPTRKFHNNVWTEVQHPDAHLVCYYVTPRQFTATRKTINQFRRERITTTQADVLCVPSRKKVIQ